MIKDNLTPFVPVVATDPFHISTLRTRLNQLITRDEELALLLAGVSTTTAAIETTGKHEITGDKLVSKGVTSGWLTKIPAYARLGSWSTAPTTFAGYYDMGAGIPVVYPSSRTTSTFSGGATTYVMNESGQIIETRARSTEELAYGTLSSFNDDPVIPLGKTFDGGTAYAYYYRPAELQYKWISNPSLDHIYVNKVGGDKVNINSVLPAGIGEYYQVTLSADMQHILVCVRSVGSPNNWADKWYLIRYTGTSAVLESQGVISTDALTDYHIGNSAWNRVYGTLTLESNNKNLWLVYCAGFTMIKVLTIGDDNIMTSDKFPLPYQANSHFTPGFYFPGAYADNGVCTAVINNFVLRLSRSPANGIDLTSGYLNFNGTNNVITSTDNLAQLNFGTGDFCIEAVVEASVVSAYNIVSTNLWSLGVIEANPGPGKVSFTNPGTSLTSPAEVSLGKPVNITIERYNGAISVYVNGIKRYELTNNYVFGTPTYLKVGDPSPHMAGKVYAVRITATSRYRGEFQMEELKAGPSDPYWNETMYLLRVDTGSIYKRRELLDSRGKLPVDWSVTKISEGVFSVEHDLGTSNFSVVPMSFAYNTKVTTDEYTSTTFLVNTFNRNASPVDSDFSCMVFLD